MINYQFLNIRRIIFHRILSKTGERQNVEVDFNNSLLTINEDLVKLLRSRLINSCGREGKSFQLEIKDDGNESVFSYIKDLNKCTDERFIDISKSLAQKLADIQNAKPNIPVGYFLLIEAQKEEENPNTVYIILKAEREDALSDEGKTLEVIQNIFLSPAQKLYKAGVFEQKNENEKLTKGDFNSFLFDSQFNDGRKLAEYFYSEYLGLTIVGNAPLETKIFYSLVNETIDTVFKNNIPLKNKCKEQIQCEMYNQCNNVDAKEIIDRIIPQEQRDKFIRKVIEKFPHPFVKDSSLIEKKLLNRSFYLTDAIRLYAPSRLFDDNIIKIENQPGNENVKVITIKTNENESR